MTLMQCNFLYDNPKVRERSQSDQATRIHQKWEEYRGEETPSQGKLISNDENTIKYESHVNNMINNILPVIGVDDNFLKEVDPCLDKQPL